MTSDASAPGAGAAAGGIGTAIHAACKAGEYASSFTGTAGCPAGTRYTGTLHWYQLIHTSDSISFTSAAVRAGEDGSSAASAGKG